MSFPSGAEAKAEFEKLKEATAKLAMLVMELNAKSSYSVFMYVSGHVSTIEIDVGKDKDDQYNVKLFEDELSYQYDYTPADTEDFNPEEEKLHYSRALDKAEYMIMKLEKFLKELEGGSRPTKLWG